MFPVVQKSVLLDTCSDTRWFYLVNEITAYDDDDDDDDTDRLNIRAVL
jgi:hypothetical protein